jgi:hypothetical protein
MAEGYLAITETFKNEIKRLLFKDLSKEQLQPLLTSDVYQDDPNAYTPPQNLLLIDRLLQECGIIPSLIFLEREYRTEMFVNDLEKRTSIEDPIELSKIISEINEIWSKKKIASIIFEERPSVAMGAKADEKQYFILFKLL